MSDSHTEYTRPFRKEIVFSNSNLGNERETD
jgi:hypothetical protein